VSRTSADQGAYRARLSAPALGRARADERARFLHERYSDCDARAAGAWGRQSVREGEPSRQVENGASARRRRAAVALRASQRGSCIVRQGDRRAGIIFGGSNRGLCGGQEQQKAGNASNFQWLVTDWWSAPQAAECRWMLAARPTGASVACRGATGWWAQGWPRSSRRGSARDLSSRPAGRPGPGFDSDSESDPGLVRSAPRSLRQRP
jgi:hypothetical protein